VQRRPILNKIKLAVVQKYLSYCRQISYNSIVPINRFLIFTAHPHCTAILARGILSVRLSVTFRCSVEMNEDTIMRFQCRCGWCINYPCPTAGSLSTIMCVILPKSTKRFM